MRRRGVATEAIDLPRGRAAEAVPEFVSRAGPGTLAGGHSFGGRVASLAAVEAEFAGLILSSFPLSGRSAERMAHFKRIACPVLMISGEDDHLAPPAELRQAVARLRRGRLLLLAGAGHGLGGHLEAALDEAAQFALSLRV